MDWYIEGNPFIIRFKTKIEFQVDYIEYPDIEGNPFIIRFKTSLLIRYVITTINIEGNPFIIRFKTLIHTLSD